MDTYESVHTGDVVLGHDGQEWGVKQILREPSLAVTLTRHGAEVTGYPPAGTAVTVLSRADTIEETRAFAVLTESFGDVSLIAEVWTS